MKQKKSPLFNILILFSICIVIFVIFLFFTKGSTKPETLSYMNKKLERENKTLLQLDPRLVDPNQAPASIRAMARLGFELMVETKKHVEKHVGGNLSCTSCHFSGGNTTGGSQGGLSLVGVATQYPTYDSRLKRVIDLGERINNCFERSLNGTPLPLDSKEMLALKTYLHWISKGLPVYGKISWIGIKPLKTTYQGDATQGKQTYDKYCALCHMPGGEGNNDAPALWGENSFNDGAGFNNLSFLATFIYWNMPYFDQTPVLTEDEAIDVAAYILQQLRPVFKKR